MNKSASIAILFATSVVEERVRFLELVSTSDSAYQVFFPDSLLAADALLSQHAIDLIITDLTFDGGAFADWLSLWPRPFILVAQYGEEHRVRELISDESCSFVMRDTSFRHINGLPIMIQKVLNVRESLNRQNTHLQLSERRYLDLVSSLPDIVYTLDGNGHFVYINESVSQLGYSPHELLGKHFSVIIEDADVPLVSRELVLSSLQGVVTGDESAPKLFDERRSGNRMTRNLDVRLKTKDLVDSTMGKVDSYGEVSSVGYTLPEYDGETIGTVGIIRDVTNRKREELKLQEDLRIKEVLLKEIHHRVKNNLQVVSSLLNLQSSSIADERSQQIFIDCQTQVQAMALVHEQLYRSDNLRSIEMDTFIESLVAYLFHVYDVDDSRIRAEISAASVSLCIDQAIPVALIVNELVSNALKHGLAESDGIVFVSLTAKDAEHLTLEVRDSGKGLPPDFRIDSSATLGFQLVQALGSQIGGGLSWTSDDGASFIVSFPYVNPSAS
ncbi:MAG: histidine kinase dimerization/phosphoacceptor domain -containing protein [Treponemataceae bacterium]